jgi:hypothetical protein
MPSPSSSSSDSSSDSDSSSTKKKAPTTTDAEELKAFLATKESKTVYKGSDKPKLAHTSKIFDTEVFLAGATEPVVAALLKATTGTVADIKDNVFRGMEKQADAPGAMSNQDIVAVVKRLQLNPEQQLGWVRLPSDTTFEARAFLVNQNTDHKLVLPLRLTRRLFKTKRKNKAVAAIPENRSKFKNDEKTEMYPEGRMILFPVLPSDLFREYKEFKKQYTLVERSITEWWRRTRNHWESKPKLPHRKDLYRSFRIAYSSIPAVRNHDDRLWQWFQVHIGKISQSKNTTIQHRKRLRRQFEAAEGGVSAERQAELMAAKSKGLTGTAGTGLNKKMKLNN